ncbi:MAG TPA: hypothetical protein VGX92_10495 [Pyrinomonadaceae bacterium]|jgi:hypothetical protein|nr:hypothetical protein [Pyrinomonadaceae bacterium]
MPTWLKALLIISLCVVLLIIGAVGLGAYWFTKHKDELLKSAQSARAEGVELGRKTDNQGCLSEALRRHREHPGFSDAIANNLFLNGCLDASRPTTGFCDGVPRSTEFIESTRWAVRKCTEENLSDSYCGQIFTQVQKYCDTHREETK